MVPVINGRKLGHIENERLTDVLIARVQQPWNVDLTHQAPFHTTTFTANCSSSIVAANKRLVGE